MSHDVKIRSLFERYDTNTNGVLDREEFFIVFKQLLSEMGRISLIKKMMKLQKKE